jgi:hypothetical protein
VPGMGEMVDDALRERVGRMAPAEVAYITKLFSQVEFRLKHTAYGHLPLELAVVDAVLMRTGQALPAGQPAQNLPAAPIPSASPAPTPITAARPTRPAPVAPAVTPSADAESSPVAIRPDRFRPDRDALPASPEPMRAVRDTPAAESGSLTLEQIDGLWNRIKMGVKMERRAKTHAVLNDVSPYEVRGNLIVLATAAKFYYDHIAEDETRLLLEKVIGGLVGQPVRIACELIGDRATNRAPGNGRPQRPAIVATPTSVAAEAAPAPVEIEPPRPASSVVATPVEPVAPPAVPGEADMHVQRVANLFDAQIFDDDEPPPFEGLRTKD